MVSTVLQDPSRPTGRAAHRGAGRCGCRLVRWLTLALAGVAVTQPAASAPEVSLPWLVCGEAPCAERARWRQWPAGIRSGPDRPAHRLELELAGGVCLTLRQPIPDRMVYDAALILRWEEPARTVLLQEIDLTRAGLPRLIVGDTQTQMVAAKSGVATVLWHRDGPPARLWKVYVVPERLRGRRYVVQIALDGYSRQQVEAMLAGLRGCGRGHVTR